jgi:O-antigen ligase
LVRQPLVGAYLLFAGVVVLAMLVHPINRFLGERQAAQIVVGAIALGVTSELARRQSARRAATAIVIGAVLPILAAAWQGLAPEVGASDALPLLDKLPAAQGLEITRQALSSFGTVGARAKGTFGDPNHFGVYLGFVICLALALTIMAAQRRSRFTQISYGAMATAASATLVATFSRSAWVGTLLSVVLIAAGIVQAWRMGAVRLPNKRVAVWVAIGALALSAGVAPRVIERVAPSSKINVVSDRTHASTVRFALRQFSTHPVLGIGPGGLGVKLRQPPRTSGAHSTYLTVAAELGAVGLLVLLLAVAVALRLLTGAYHMLGRTPLVVLALALGAAYLGYLASNVTYDVWFDDFHWVILGGVVALAADARAIGWHATPEVSPDGRADHDLSRDRALTLAARLSQIARHA